jgi:hypothetical protein
VDRFWEFVDREEDDACWPWRGGTDARGRPFFRSIGGLGIHADRFAFELSRGKVEQGEIVHHTCGRSDCMNPTHLSIARPQAVSSRPGNYKTGSGSKNAKLTEASVGAIRRRLAAGEPVNVLAAEYGVSQVTISRAARGRDWKQVT